MKKCVAFIFILTLSFSTLSCSHSGKEQFGNFDPRLKAIDPYTLVGEKNLLTDYESVNADATVNVIIEIPAGTNAKWEVTKPEGSLKWEFRNGKPRVVRYLAYPANYGMIPQTLLPLELGGDGDPLDIVVLGPTVPRGSVIQAKVIGVLRLRDGGEQDDKLIAVLANSPLYSVDDLADLDTNFPGVTAILEMWFLNYKGANQIESRGFGGVDEAKGILMAAIDAFEGYTQQGNTTTNLGNIK